MKKPSTILVEIKGGFGNQIFQFAFANKLRDAGFNVYINKKDYSEKFINKMKLTPRELIINEKLFDFKQINFIFLKFFKLHHQIISSKKVPGIIKRFSESKFIKLKDSNFNESFLDKKFIHLDGYWQNVQNLLSQKDYIIKSISKIPIIKKSLENTSNKNTVMMLIRRGDYVKMNEDLSIGFYKRCIENIALIYPDYKLNIFTDDLDWVKREKLFDIAENIYGPKDKPQEVIQLFSKMLQHNNFIVGNSTFSLIAAILSLEKNKKILISKPWFRNKNKDIFNEKKLDHDNWIFIENE